MPLDSPVRIARTEQSSPLATTIYAQIDALSIEHGIAAGEMVSLLAFKAFLEMNLDGLQFWIGVSDIGIERTATGA